jgi:hypothetical protein
MNCPTCGSIVQVEGNTTKYYVPLWQEERQTLEARVKEMEAGLAKSVAIGFRLTDQLKGLVEAFEAFDSCYELHTSCMACEANQPLITNLRMAYDKHGLKEA